MCFWVKRKTKIRDAGGKIGVLDCIDICVLSQMHHEKSRSVRRAEGFGMCFWLKISEKSRKACGKIQVLDYILRKCVQKFYFLAFRKGIAHRIISRSIDI